MKQEPLATRYDPASFEQKWYAEWESKGYFTPEAKTDLPAFSIVIPPPNVTGRLHNGHALVNTLIDVQTRWKRMSGFNTLWLPGTDHAGIATQMVVERELAKEGLSRVELGRETFEEKVWEWKERHKNEISDQLPDPANLGWAILASLVVTAVGVWFAGDRLRSFSLRGED